MSFATKICPYCTSPAVYRQKNNTCKCTVCNKTIGKASTDPFRDPVIDPFDPAGDKSGLPKFVMPFLLLLGITSIAIFFYQRSKTSKKKSVSSLSTWREPKVFRYYAFNCSKGPVIWEIMRQYRKGGGDALYYLRILDPINNEKISELDIEGASETDLKDFSSHFYREFIQQGDTLFNGSEEGGLQAYDVYSGKRILDNVQASNFFSQLKGQKIVKVVTRSWNSEFVITVENGDDYFYNPRKHYFRNKEEEKILHENDTIKIGQFCFSRGKKASLYYLHRPEHYDAFIHDYELESYFKGESYYVKNIGPLKKISETFYPYPKMLSASEKECVIAYTSDFSADGALVIEKINQQGRSLWKSTDPGLLRVKQKIYGDNLDLNFKINNGVLTIYNSDMDEHHSIGIDLATGKTLFRHSQSEKLY